MSNRRRLALIAGEQSLTDPQWVAPFEQLAKWGPYLGDGFEAQTYPDSQNLFTLGRAGNVPNSPGSFGTYTKGKTAVKVDDHTVHIKTAKPYPLMVPDLMTLAIVSPFPPMHEPSARNGELNS